MEPEPIFVNGPPPIKIAGRGRPKGSGCNLRLLKGMKAGDSMWHLSFKKMNSIRVSAQKNGIKIKVRALPDKRADGGVDYAIWKL